MQKQRQMQNKLNLKRRIKRRKLKASNKLQHQHKLQHSILHANYTHCGFFSHKKPCKQFEKPDIIHMNNMLAHEKAIQERLSHYKNPQ
jgi:hypothetical protein